jgi:hypothetical protein
MEVAFVAGVARLWEREQNGMRMPAVIVVAIDASVLPLSAAGIHAMMPFTVARRRGEIGIRMAHGAPQRRREGMPAARHGSGSRRSRR